MGDRRQVDYGILLTVSALLAVGLVMVLSASYVEAGQDYGDPYYFFKRQLMWMAIGLAGMWLAAKIDYDFWNRHAGVIMWLSIGLLVLVLVPGIGIASHGARRWLGFGQVRFQPSEVAKLTAVMYASHLLGRTPLGSRDLRRGLLPTLTMLLLLAALMMIEPDLGTTVATVGTVGVILLMAELPWTWAGGLIAAAAPVLAFLIFGEEYRRRRFLAFLNPEADPLGAGYHITQGLYALGEGTLFGSGLGGSLQKYFWVPERHTDFIFAILGDELGFVGAAAVIALFALFAWRGYRVAITVGDRFGALLATGLTTLIVVQAVINIGVVTSVLPVTGITLPFISFGGSSLVFSLTSVGMLLNISRHAKY